MTCNVNRMNVATAGGQPRDASELMNSGTQDGEGTANSRSRYGFHGWGGQSASGRLVVGRILSGLSARGGVSRTVGAGNFNIQYPIFNIQCSSGRSHFSRQAAKPLRGISAGTSRPTFRSTAFNFRPSTIHHQPPTINHPPPTTNHSHQPSTNFERPRPPVHRPKHHFIGLTPLPDPFANEVNELIERL